MRRSQVFTIGLVLYTALLVAVGVALIATDHRQLGVTSLVVAAIGVAQMTVAMRRRSRAQG
jgi:hypothetical protein